MYATTNQHPSDSLLQFEYLNDWMNPTQNPFLLGTSIEYSKVVNVCARFVSSSMFKKELINYHMLNADALVLLVSIHVYCPTFSL